MKFVAKSVENTAKRAQALKNCAICGTFVTHFEKL